MITLYGFGAGFGLPEISPFVTKTEVQLKMAGLAYRKEKAKPPAGTPETIKGARAFLDAIQLSVTGDRVTATVEVSPGLVPQFLSAAGLLPTAKPQGP